MATLAQGGVAHPESLNGIMARTDPASAYMHDIGGTMKQMGPYAPPCVVEPYRAMRETLLNSIGKVLEETKAQLGAEKFEAWRNQWLVPLMQMASMPDVTEVWTDAPMQWHRPMVTIEGLRRGHGAALGRTYPLLEWTDFCEQYMAMTGKPCPRGTEHAWLTYGRQGLPIIVGLIVSTVAAPPVAIAYWVGVGLYQLGQTTSSQQVSSNFATMVQVLDQVRTVFIPEVYQQMVSAKKLIASSGGDPTRLEQSMRATNPWLEPSLPENWDGNFAVVPVPVSVSAPTSPWVPLLFGLLLALGVGAILGGDS